MTDEFRLGKLACPRVNDDLKIHVDDHKLSSGRPHDNWILEKLSYEILCFFPSFFFFFFYWLYCSAKELH